jgi:hypothetical protein
VSLHRAHDEEPRRVAGEAPRTAPLATATADAHDTVTFPSVPANFDLLAYGKRADERMGWVLTSAHPAWQVKPDYGLGVGREIWVPQPSGYPT